MKFLSLDGLTDVVNNIKNLINSSSNTTLTNAKAYTDTKLASKSDTSHTHNYAGSDSTGGIATNADKLDNYHADAFAKLTGANFTGAVTIVSSALNGSYNGLLVGDDCYIGDCNIVNTIGLMGQTDNNIAYIKFGKGGKSLGYNGTTLVYDNSMVYTGKNITYGTASLTPGSSSLATGSIYLQYE